MSTGPKETVYDAELNPLIAKVIELCKEHGIVTFMHFELDDCGDDERVLCTTSIPPESDEDPGSQRIAKMRAAAFFKPTFMGMTVTTTGEG